MLNGLDNFTGSSEHETRIGNFISSENCTFRRYGSANDLDTFAFIFDSAAVPQR